MSEFPNAPNYPDIHSPKKLPKSFESQFTMKKFQVNMTMKLTRIQGREMKDCKGPEISRIYNPLEEDTERNLPPKPADPTEHLHKNQQAITPRK
jgi:hypothetical protein